MEFIQITDMCYYFRGSVNIGYVHSGGKGILIDAGIDRGTMKKVLKKLDELGLPITHLLITHSHADHFGGAFYLQNQRQVYTIAPMLEEAILRNPVLEPIYLFQGNWPLQELRNKFLEGEAIRVDEIAEEGDIQLDELAIKSIALPGHSYYQLGYIIDGVMYCGDAVFGLEALEKHKIPYIVDAEQTLHSLNRLLSLPVKRLVVGHGNYEEDCTALIEENIRWHKQIIEKMKHIIGNCAGLSHEQLVRDMCNASEVELKTISSWLLYRTAITGYLLSLVKEGEALLSIRDNSLWIGARK